MGLATHGTVTMSGFVWRSGELPSNAAAEAGTWVLGHGTGMRNSIGSMITQAIRLVWIVAGYRQLRSEWNLGTDLLVLTGIFRQGGVAMAHAIQDKDPVT